MNHALKVISSACKINSLSSINGKPWDITLAIIKPDACNNPFVRQHIQDMILENNIYFVKSKYFKLSIEDAKRFYDVHKEKFFFNRLVTFMSSGQILVHLLTGEDVISRWRQLMGPTKSFRAQFDAPHSIRGMFGLTDTRNATHGSDSLSSVLEEAKFFFPEFNYELWLRECEPLFRQNLVEYDAEAMQHKFR